VSDSLLILEAAKEAVKVADLLVVAGFFFDAKEEVSAAAAES
jgi:hypothetical protein